MNWDHIIAEATTTLQELLRFDTTNPPGNETPCIEYIARKLTREGIAPAVLEAAPGRGNLVARLTGDGSLPPLMLMGHVDVVPAEADKWERAPFSGDLYDGIVWGRGATDMKQMVTMELLAFLLVKRENVPLKRDLIFMANADEETGANMGAAWMVRNHPDLIRAEYAINEDGATSILLGDQVFYVCSTAEKGVARFTLRAHGEPGHASQPNMNNALLPLARAVANLIENPLPLRVCAPARAHVEAMALGVAGELRANVLSLLDPAQHQRALTALPLADAQKSRLSAALHNTAVPTILKAGSRVNVIPGEAECQVDCRILPGATRESLEQELRAVVGSAVDIEFGPIYPALESDPNSPLFETIRQAVEKHEKGARLVPGLITCGTDAKRVTQLGTQVLGFVPMRYEGPSMTGLGHNHNERVSVANLEFGTRVIYDIVTSFCGKG